jgi:predicted nucleic acid-binding Zn ribbon protein
LNNMVKVSPYVQAHAHTIGRQFGESPHAAVQLLGGIAAKPSSERAVAIRSVFEKGGPGSSVAISTMVETGVVEFKPFTKTTDTSKSGDLELLIQHFEQYKEIPMYKKVSEFLDHLDTVQNVTTEEQRTQFWEIFDKLVVEIPHFDSFGSQEELDKFKKDRDTKSWNEIVSELNENKSALELIPSSIKQISETFVHRYSKMQPGEQISSEELTSLLALGKEALPEGFYDKLIQEIDDVRLVQPELQAASAAPQKLTVHIGSGINIANANTKAKEASGIQKDVFDATGNLNEAVLQEMAQGDADKVKAFIKSLETHAKPAYDELIAKDIIKKDGDNYIFDIDKHNSVFNPQTPDSTTKVKSDLPLYLNPFIAIGSVLASLIAAGWAIFSGQKAQQVAKANQDQQMAQVAQALQLIISKMEQTNAAASAEMRKVLQAFGIMVKGINTYIVPAGSSAVNNAAPSMGKVVVHSDTKTLNDDATTATDTTQPPQQPTDPNAQPTPDSQSGSQAASQAPTPSSATASSQGVQGSVTSGQQAIDEANKAVENMKRSASSKSTPSKDVKASSDTPPLQQQSVGQQPQQQPAGPSYNGTVGGGLTSVDQQTLASAVAYAVVNALSANNIQPFQQGQQPPQVQSRYAPDYTSMVPQGVPSAGAVRVTYDLSGGDHKDSK